MSLSSLSQSQGQDLSGFFGLNTKGHDLNCFVLFVLRRCRITPLPACISGARPVFNWEQNDGSPGTGLVIGPGETLQWPSENDGERTLDCLREHWIAHLLPYTRLAPRHWIVNTTNWSECYRPQTSLFDCPHCATHCDSNYHIGNHIEMLHIVTNCIAPLFCILRSCALLMCCPNTVVLSIPLSWWGLKETSLEVWMAS